MHRNQFFDTTSITIVVLIGSPTEFEMGVLTEFPTGFKMRAFSHCLTKFKVWQYEK